MEHNWMLTVEGIKTVDFSTLHGAIIIPVGELYYVIDERFFFKAIALVILGLSRNQIEILIERISQIGRRDSKKATSHVVACGFRCPWRRFVLR